MAGILASAANPEILPPIEVFADADGQYLVKDGRRRYLALCEQHGEGSEVEIRCTICIGTEVEAVEEVCDQAVGSVVRTPIETARAIYNIQRVAHLSQKAVCERFPSLNKDQVSRMAIAAKTFVEYPSVFNLLAEPDRVSIDVCVRFAQLMKAASDEELGAVRCWNAQTLRAARVNRLRIASCSKPLALRRFAERNSQTAICPV